MTLDICLLCFLIYMITLDIGLLCFLNREYSLSIVTSTPRKLQSFPIFDSAQFGDMTKTMNELIAADTLNAKSSKTSHTKSSEDIASNPLGFHPSRADVKKALFESHGFPASSFGLPIDNIASDTCKHIRGQSLDDMCHFFRLPVPMPSTDTGTSKPLHDCDQGHHVDTQSPGPDSTTVSRCDLIANHGTTKHDSVTICANQSVNNCVHTAEPQIEDHQLTAGEGGEGNRIAIAHIAHADHSDAMLHDDSHHISSTGVDNCCRIVEVEDSLPHDEVEPSPNIPDVIASTTNSNINNDDVTVPRAGHDKSSYDVARKKRMIELTKLFQWPSKMISVLADNATSSSPESQAPGKCTSTSTATGKASVLQPIDASSSRHEYLQSLQKIMSSTSISTSFSGIDTPATALMMLSAGLFDELGVDSSELDTQLVLKHTPRNLWACEWFSRSQSELLRHPHQPDHIFSDINTFWLKSIGNRIKALVDHQLIDTVLKKLILTTSTVKTTGYCIRCQKECVVSQMIVK